MNASDLLPGLIVHESAPPPMRPLFMLVALRGGHEWTIPAKYRVGFPTLDGAKLAGDRLLLSAAGWQRYRVFRLDDDLSGHTSGASGSPKSEPMEGDNKHLIEAMREVRERLLWHCDLDADEDDGSPEDAVAHVNGLCVKIIDAALQSGSARDATKGEDER